MLFRVRVALTGLHATTGDGIALSLSGRFEPVVSISVGPHPGAPSQEVVLAESVGKTDAPSEFADKFASIAEGARPYAGQYAHGDSDDAFLRFCYEVFVDLDEAAKQVFYTARWRSGAASQHTAQLAYGPEFRLGESRDWLGLPSPDFHYAELVPGIRLNQSTEYQVQQLVSQGRSEPTAHHMLREAREASSVNHRSAMLLAIAAAETGFKDLVAELVPNASWLMANVPSPPLVRMIKEYLPQLPVRNLINDEVPVPPKYVRRLLTDGVGERNRIAHVGASLVGRTEAKMMVAAVEDLLYLFDFCSGEQWALDRISTEFRSAMVAEASDSRT